MQWFSVIDINDEHFDIWISKYVFLFLKNNTFKIFLKSVFNISYCVDKKYNINNSLKISVITVQHVHFSLFFSLEDRKSKLGRFSIWGNIALQNIRTGGVTTSNSTQLNLLSCFVSCPSTFVQVTCWYTNTILWNTVFVHVMQAISEVFFVSACIKKCFCHIHLNISHFFKTTI